MIFEYGERETGHLCRKDRRMARAIASIGHIGRECDSDLFSSLVRHIVGQQISMRAQATIWQRLCDSLGQVDAAGIAACSEEHLQSMGMSLRKAAYIRECACKVQSGELDLAAIATMDDANAIATLSSLRGIGVWTAEMLLLFCLQRPDVLSYDDLAIRRGLRMLYRHRHIDRARFERYRKRFSPYGSVASLYLWAIAGGALPELTDPAARVGRQPAR